MDYFSILNLNKEPFSNSPDPDYFFQSRQHVSCLQKLELSLRLKRGLNVVIGDVGTGKTTLCRQLLRRFAEDDNVATHLILDPYFSSPIEFLKTVAQTLTGETLSDEKTDDWQVKEIIKKFLYQKGVDEDNLVILIIDEGQKIPSFCLELLREFLNYETNEHKLLQIAIFAQKEFEQTLEAHANFTDRINLYHQLQPMNFKDTRMMIQFRLAQSSASSKSIAPFSYPALWLIYRATKGYPRKIVNLCHRCILAMIIQNRSKANWLLVRSSIRRTFGGNAAKGWRLALLLYMVLILVLAFEYLPSTAGNFLSALPSKKQTADTTADSLSSMRHKITSHDASAAGQPATGAETTAPNRPTPTKTAPVSPSTSAEQSTPAPQTTAEVAPTTSGEPTIVARLDPSQQQPTADRLDEMLPLFLGHIAVQRHETLGAMIQKIYGLYNNSYLNYIAKVNPNIINPDNIRIGDLILFPAIPAQVKPLPVTVYWVAIHETGSIEEAYNVLRTLPAGIPTGRLIPYWNPQEGLRFMVVLRRYFFDEKSALFQLNKLDSLVSASGRVISNWDDRNVFFANPY